MSLVFKIDKGIWKMSARYLYHGSGDFLEPAACIELPIGRGVRRRCEIHLSLEPLLRCEHFRALQLHVLSQSHHSISHIAIPQSRRGT